MTSENIEQQDCQGSYEGGGESDAASDGGGNQWAGAQPPQAPQIEGHLALRTGQCMETVVCIPAQFRKGLSTGVTA